LILVWLIIYDSFTHLNAIMFCLHKYKQIHYKRTKPKYIYVLDFEHINALDNVFLNKINIIYIRSEPDAQHSTHHTD